MLMDKMAAVNGVMSVMDNLVASDGAGKRDVMVASSSAVASKLMVEDNAECKAEEDVRVAVSGGDKFSTPLKATGTEDGGDAILAVAGASTGQESSAEATAFVWEIGQRVKVLGKCEGLVLFTGKDAVGLWYGVALDLGMGENDGSTGGVRYFNCLAKHGVFVQSEKLQAADMLANDILLKAILGGAVVPESELKKLFIQHLYVYLKHKDVSFKVKKGWLKPDYFTMALRVMCAVLPTATLVQVPGGKPGEDRIVAVKGKEGGESAHDSETDDLLAEIESLLAGDDLLAEIESLNQPVNAHGQNELVSSTTGSPLVGGQSLTTPLAYSTALPSTVQPAVLDADGAADVQRSVEHPTTMPTQDGVAGAVEIVDTAPAKENSPGFTEILKEGSFLEWLVASVQDDVEGSLNKIVNAVGSKTTKKSQLKGPMDKMRKVWEIMESVYASIEFSAVSDSEEASVASSVTTVSSGHFRSLWPGHQFVPAKVAEGGMTSNGARFRLTFPVAASVPELWSAALPALVVKAPLAAPVFFPIVVPPVVPQPIFSRSFAPTGHVGQEIGGTAVGHAMSGRPPTSVVGQEIGVTSQDRGYAIEVTGEIVNIIRSGRYGYVRAVGGGDYFFGKDEYHSKMSIGDRVKFTHYPNWPLMGTCPMAMEVGHVTLSGEVVHSKDGETAGAQPAAMASANPWNQPKRTVSGVINGGRVGSSAPNTTTQLGVNAKVVKGAVKSSVEVRAKSNSEAQFSTNQMKALAKMFADVLVQAGIGPAVPRA